MNTRYMLQHVHEEQALDPISCVESNEHTHQHIVNKDTNQTDEQFVLCC